MKNYAIICRDRKVIVMSGSKGQAAKDGKVEAEFDMKLYESRNDTRAKFKAIDFVKKKLGIKGYFDYSQILR